MFKKGALGVALAAALATMHVQAVPGDLDSTFGTNGVLDIGGSCSHVREVFETSDGGLLAVGQLSPNGTIFLKKYDANGTSLDLSFGNNGIAEQNNLLSYTGISVMDADMLYNGKIAVVAKAYSGTAPTDVYIAVFNPDGTPDTTFSYDGTLNYNQNHLTMNKQDNPESILGLPDGRIIVGLSADMSQTSSVSMSANITRFNPDGTLDKSISNGRASLGLGTFKDMALAADNSLFTVTQYSGNRIRKVPTPGTSAVNFGTNGLYQFNLPSTVATSIAVQADGKVLIAGKKGDNAFIARLNPTGANPLDTTFGNGTGYIEYNSPVLKDQITSITTESNGDITAVGISASSTSQPTQDVLLFKADANGNLITSFGVNGFVFYDRAGAMDNPRDAKIQADGKVLVPAITTEGTVRKCTVLRYMP